MDKKPKPVITRTETEWRAGLSELEYQITRKKVTERAFTGAYWNSHDPGVYRCKCCGEPLFSSTEKFDSGCGWPSFSAPITEDAVAEHDDSSHSMHRIEVTCTACAAHLGHVFPDGPGPTGLRYCINSASVDLKADAEANLKASDTAAPQKKDPQA